MAKMINDIYLNELNSIISCDLLWENLKNKNVLVTGGTGLIGSCIIDVLMQLKYVNVFCMGRNKEKAISRFGEYFNKDNFNFICHNISNKFECDTNFDYIIHAASGANPFEFNNRPVETMLGNFLGTYNLLEYAKEHKVERFLFVSSGEVYGEARDGIVEFDENYSGYLDPIKVRSCYPNSKRASETLISSYISEYGINGVVVRPCHVFGPTMTNEDSRVASEFIRNAVSGDDILLKSRGGTIRSYMYVIDAVSALFYVLFLGKNGDAYNLSGGEKISIKELAEIISKASGNRITFEDKLSGDANMAVLDNNKLLKLGWNTLNSIEEGVIKTINILRGANNAK